MKKQFFSLLKGSDVSHSQGGGGKLRKGNSPVNISKMYLFIQIDCIIIFIKYIDILFSVINKIYKDSNL